MLRKWGSVSLVLIIPVLLLSACSTAQERARKKLEARGIQFTDKAFVDSASKGDGDALKLFLAAGMNPNVFNSDGKPAVVVAALAGNETIVDQLLDAGADVNLKTKDGQTALMGAAVNGNTRIVNMLLSRGADLNVKDSHEFTALMYADGANKPEVRAVLVKAGAQDSHPWPLETPTSPIPLPKKKLERS
jgi:ankyrin repeat protein